MSKFFAVIVMVLSIFAGLFYMANLEKVQAGYVGIKVYLLGSEKGVDDEEVGPGRYFIGLNTELFKFPTFAVNWVWTQDPTEGSINDESVTFQSVEGMNIGADVGITYSIDASKVSILYQRYRKGIEEITDIYLRNAVRDALVSKASIMPVRSIYGIGKTGLMQSVQEQVIEQVGRYGIIVERIYWIGALRLPETVVASVNSEIAATAVARKRENEIAGSKAEAEKVREEAAGKADAILALAEAQAKANRLLAESLTPEIVAYQAMQKWNGVLPKVTGGAIPMINIPTDVVK